MKTPMRNFSRERLRTFLSVLTSISMLSSFCTKSADLKDETLKKVTAPAKISSIDNTITNRLLPPSSVRSSYSSSPNPSISDDFNDATVDMTKWQYRTDGTAKWGTNSNYVYIATNGTQRFLSVKGSYADQKGSGITTRTTAKYGFYIAKWKLSGIDATSYNVWHPAIWGGPCDYSFYPQGNCIDEFKNAPRQWLEADIMETYEGSAPGWESHMLLWDQTNKPNSPDKVMMIPKNTAFPTSTNWEILGMEYRPTFIKMWRFDWGSNMWTEVKSVPITTQPQSTTNMNVNNRTALYWILSNNLLKPGITNPPNDSDSWLHVDYFYCYDYLGQ